MVIYLHPRKSIIYIYIYISKIKLKTKRKAPKLYTSNIESSVTTAATRLSFPEA